MRRGSQPGAALHFVGLHGAEQAEPAALSFGTQRLVELARALGVAAPDCC